MWHESGTPIPTHTKVEELARTHHRRGLLNGLDHHKLVVLTMTNLVHWHLVGGWRIIVLTGIAIRQKHH